MTRTPGQVGALYESLASVEVREGLVWDADVHRFSAALTALRRAIGDHEVLVPMLRSLGRLRFDLMACPASPRALDPTAAQTRLGADRFLIVTTLPRAQPAVEETLRALGALAASRANPLLDALIDSPARSAGAATPVLLRESRLIGPAQAAAEDAGHAGSFQWMTPHELRVAGAMEAMVVVGSPRWFPEHVFTAPRSPLIHAIRHRWISADWERVRAPALTVSRADESSSGHRAPVIRRDRAPAAPPTPVAEVPARDFLPTLDLGERDSHRGPRDPAGSADDEVDAIVLRLEGDDFVLMEDVAGNLATVVDLDQPDDPVRRVPARQLRPGMFVLLRTERGGDYVAEVADKVLGPYAVTTRAAQRRWKTGLRAAVRSRGPRAVIAELRRRGSSVANPPNLRYWISPDSIRTRERSDFDAILSVAGLEGDRDDLWRQMGHIGRAHTRAGQVIRDRLLAEVRRADPRHLLRHGRLDFELEDGGGALTALRVEEVLPGRRMALRGELDRVLSAD